MYLYLSFRALHILYLCFYCGSEFVQFYFAFANGLYFGSGQRLSTSGGKGSLISSVSAWGPLSDISARWSILHQALSVFLFLRKQPKRQVVKGDPWNRNETITMNNILVDSTIQHLQNCGIHLTKVSAV